jgi:hypothetical protein
MSLRFADLERKLGEIDQARAIYGYCSQMCSTTSFQQSQENEENDNE